MINIEKNKDNILSIMSDSLLRKNVVSNYFNQPFHQGDALYYTDHTSVLCVKNNSFTRLFLLSDEGEDCITVLSSLPNNRYVINIPTKNDISTSKEILSRSGFAHTNTFVRLYNTKIKPGNVDRVIYADESLVGEIINLLNRHFTDYLSYIPDRTELKALIKDKNVIVKVEDGVLKGVFVLEFNGKKAYFRIWADESKQGLDLIINAFAVVASKNINYVYNWVNLENTKSLTIYKFFGAKPDGLYDYVFLKEM